MDERRRDLAERPEGLTHNPFAALRGAGGDPAPPGRAPESPGVEDPQGDPDAPDDPLGRSLVLTRERSGRRGKTVTRLSGLPRDAGEDVARRLARVLGCGWSREADDVLLQGDQVERAARWLEERGADRVVRG